MPMSVKAAAQFYMDSGFGTTIPDEFFGIRAEEDNTFRGDIVTKTMAKVGAFQEVNLVKYIQMHKERAKYIQRHKEETK